MTRYAIVLSVLFVFLAGARLHAQSSHNGLSIKKTFVDYNSLNGGDFDFRNWNSGMEIGYLRKINDHLSLEVPLKLASVQFVDSLTNTTLLSLDLQLHYWLSGMDNRWNPYIGIGAGGVMEDFDEFNLELPVLVGANIKVGDHTYFNLEGSFRYGLEENRDNLQIGLGFKHFFGTKEEMEEPIEEEMPEEEPIPDSDGDGINDDVDLCPQEAGLEKFLGCPDSDNDGLPDGEDECPYEAGPESLKGCPDSDGDGVSDKMDECPNLFGLKENRGCPSNDKDNDGVPDAIDDCPDEPGLAMLRGCPDSDGDGLADFEDRCPEAVGARVNDGCPDSDGDGVNDLDDRCPETAGPASNKGCPELEEEEKKVLEFAVQNVEFETGRHTLRPQSFSMLDQIADILKKYPGYHLRIVGHTDDVGSEASNQKLSEQRARSCYEYLNSKGIPTGRLSYVGMGESKPIASNATAEGKSRNRRVEFELYIE